jgi:Cu-Zn family superoxide dismutase
MGTKLILALGLVFLAAGIVSAEPLVKMKPKAKAALINAEGKEVGTALFEEVPGGLRLSLKVSNFPPGFHAFHVHSVGLCEPPDFKSAGPHFNPFHKKHGRQNPEGPHAGDLQDLYVGPDGTGDLDALVPALTLSGEGGKSLFHPGGTALVIHASPDDNKTDPAGNAGDRIACGVITRLP